MGLTYRQEQEGRLSVSEMDNNFHYIEDYLTGLTNSIAGLGDVAGITASISTLNSDVSGITASIISLEGDVSGITASISTLNSDVAGITASIIDLQNAFSNITGDFNFLLLVGGNTQSGTFSFTNGILGTYSI